MLKCHIPNIKMTISLQHKKIRHMKTTRINNRITTSTLSGIAQLLRQFSDKREGLIWIYLLSLADDEGKVDSSVNAMALQLNIHRQTLSRFIKHLCDQGYATWEIKGSSRQPNVLRITALATGETTTAVTEERTTAVTEERTTFVTENATVHTTPDNSAMHMKPEGYENEDNPYATTDVTTCLTTCLTTDVTGKREKKQKKEKNPPAPPEKEKKQKKDKNPHTNACACEKKPEEKIERRRQQFLDALTPYIGRYNQEMITRFGDYWTEPNRSLTKMRFELQRTWSTPLRLATWARNDKSFNQYHNNHDKTTRPTTAELIADAQRTAIEETERFIRESEIRRGGIPPHLPF